MAPPPPRTGGAHAHARHTPTASYETALCARRYSVCVVHKTDRGQPWHAHVPVDAKTRGATLKPTRHAHSIMTGVWIPRLQGCTAPDAPPCDGAIMLHNGSRARYIQTTARSRSHILPGKVDFKGGVEGWRGAGGWGAGGPQRVRCGPSTVLQCAYRHTVFTAFSVRSNSAYRTLRCLRPSPPWLGSGQRGAGGGGLARGHSLAGCPKSVALQTQHSKS